MTSYFLNVTEVLLLFCLGSHTFPPLSFNPIIFWCFERLTMDSSGKSMPVFAGTLYKITGTGQESAT